MQSRPHLARVRPTAALAITAGLISVGFSLWPTERPPAPTSTTSFAASASPGWPPSPGSATPVPAKGPLRVVALGDSVPAGTACDCDGFVQDVAAGLGHRAGRAATPVNLAVPGAATADVVHQLDDHDVQAQLRQANVVLIQVGANDVDTGLLDLESCLGNDGCWDGEAQQVETNLRRILTTVDTLRPSGSRVVVLDYWNVAEAGEVGAGNGTTYVTNAARATAAVNAAIKRQAGVARAVYVDTSAAFHEDDHTETELLASDGDHPSQAGQDVLAQAVLRALS